MASPSMLWDSNQILPRPPMNHEQERDYKKLTLLKREFRLTRLTLAKGISFSSELPFYLPPPPLCQEGDVPIL